MNIENRTTKQNWWTSLKPIQRFIILIVICAVVVASKYAGHSGGGNNTDSSNYSVNTNSRSYQIGYDTGMQNVSYSPIYCDRGPVDGMGRQSTIGTSDLNWDDFMAGCQAGKADSR